ncbi:ribosomal protein S12 methylthiotransferase accessory factor [Actinopolyspora lacussalsi]|nr:ribosomal protein S12 methylthiotransferase accessory factor [Actinopolyspora lacussalsi]
MNPTAENSGRLLVGFKSYLRLEVVSGDAAYVFSERGVTALEGSGMELIAPMLDGTRNLEDLYRDLPEGVTSQQAGSLLIQLAEANLLELRDPVRVSSGNAAERAYWETAGLDADTVRSETIGATVGLIALGDVDEDSARQALTGAGLRVRTADTAAAPHESTLLSVVLCDDYLRVDLGEVDARHRATNKPWLLAKPVGAQLWVGPVFDPSESERACWHCMATRIWGHRQAEAHVQATLRKQGPAHRVRAAIPALTATGMHLVALEASKWLAGYRSAEQRGVWTLDSLDLGARHHDVRPRPQCRSCGDPDLVRNRAWHPVEVRSRRKAEGTGGGSRSRTARQTLDDYRHLVSPVTGVIKEIRQDPRGPALFNSFRSGPNLAVGNGGVERLRTALRTENGGKGTTPLHAEVSALCEALERHCGYFHGDEERVRGSFRALSDRAIHPDTCQLFDERQYTGRAEWNRRHSPFQFVCDPFDEEAELDWTPVWSMTRKQHRLLPTGMLYFDAPGSSSVRADSNGNAAGSSVEDAVLQGLLELVERDAVALWWYNRTRAAGVDLDSFTDPWIDEVRAAHAGLDRQLWVLDVTSDLGVPTMVAISRRTDKPSEDIMFGFGAHLSPQVALHRCLTELNQLMPTMIGIDDDGDYGWSDPDAVHWWRTATVHNQPYLLPDPKQRPRTAADHVAEQESDLLAELSLVQRRLEASGMELLVLDQTRPDIGLPVVKTIVPGLRSFWARFGPGRLYDVPVRLGRVAEPTRYEDLNPLPLFL